MGLNIKASLIREIKRNKQLIREAEAQPRGTLRANAIRADVKYAEKVYTDGTPEEMLDTYLTLKSNK